MGSFFMVGRRQTSMASGSIIRPASNGFCHDYHDKRAMNTSLLPLVQSLINRLAEEAVQTQNSCGEIIVNLYRSVMEKCGISMNWGEVCVYNILTYNFFNSSHRDRDCMLKIDSNRVKDHVFGSNIQPLIQ